MTELSFEWTRFVLPKVRIQEGVLSLPFWLRVPLAYRHSLALAVHGVAGRAIEGWYRKRGKELGVHDPRTGMLTVIQRFGSDLALNVHYHSLVPDGVFDVHGHFTPVPAPMKGEMTLLCTTIVKRVTRLFERRCLDDDLDEDERALCEALAHSARRQGATAHKDPDADPDHDASPWAGLIKARVDGFDLECTTVVREDDRDRLEQLCKYLLRPPLARRTRADHRRRRRGRGGARAQDRAQRRHQVGDDAGGHLPRAPLCARGPASASTRSSTAACSALATAGARRWCRLTKARDRNISRGPRS